MNKQRVHRRERKMPSFAVCGKWPGPLYLAEVKSRVTCLDCQREWERRKQRKRK